MKCTACGGEMTTEAALASKPLMFCSAECMYPDAEGFAKGKLKRDEALKVIGAAVQIAVQPLLAYEIPNDNLTYITQLVANDTAQHIYKERYDWDSHRVVVEVTETEPGAVSISVTFERTNT